MDNKQLFARNLKNARKSAGLSQAKLGDMLSYSAKAISKWESGTAFAPSEVLPLLAKALNTDINSLFDFRESASWFLGVDGGGTKTKFVLADIDGNIIKEMTLGSSNPTSVGFETCANVLCSGILQICKGIPLGKVSAFIGAAGCGLEANRQEVLKRIKHLNLSSLTLASDAKNIISAGLEGKNGVVVILGTGSVIFVSMNGKAHQIGGYGHFIGDNFSGTELGRACLEAVFSDLDKSGEPTMLTKMVTDLKGTDVSRIILDMYSQGKTYLSELAELVFKAADKNDAVACEIIARNTDKLAKQLTSALALLPKNEKFRVVFAGGITNYVDKFIEDLKSKITADNLESISVLSKEPVMGALMLARTQKGE